MRIVIGVLFLVLCEAFVSNELPELKNYIKVNKCCEPDEIFEQNHCRKASDLNQTKWQPVFKSEHGESNINVNFEYITGSPDCGSHQQWGVYFYHNSSDELRLLPNGKLRHYIYRLPPGDQISSIKLQQQKKISYDYELGRYCVDKRIDDGKVAEYALVCGPEHQTDYLATEFLMRNIINPITHIFAIACFLTVAIVYFVMPTLKDLTGNIVTTMSVCMIVSQSADLIRILTIFNSHISLIITETVCYISLLGAFFWLNSLAYYIWKTFKARNVYLRITDSKKYCYYSAYVWSCTSVMGFLAVFAHYTMDYDTTKPVIKFDDQEQIGSLAMIIFFMPIAFTVLVNIFFFATTLKILGRMNTYGRIHHKLKHSFRMFLLLFLIMTLTWIFFLMSFTNYDGLVYSYIIINMFQAPLFAYVCLINQKHVSYLLRKTCCYTNCICACCRPEPEPEWGDEMTAMNNGIYS